MCSKTRKSSNRAHRVHIIELALTIESKALVLVYASLC